MHTRIKDKVFNNEEIKLLLIIQLLQVAQRFILHTKHTVWFVCSGAILSIKIHYTSTDITCVMCKCPEIP
jgi:hypothetical protein